MTATTHRPTTRSGVAWVLVVVALAVVAFGLLWLPYYGDQALYAVIGRDVVAGRPLYTGIWDIKQPGIFLLYGLLPSPVVTRAVAVAVAVGVAVLVARLLEGRVSAALGRWVPVIAVAVLLLPVRPLDLGQVEQLVGLPAIAALVLVVRRPSTARTVLAGVCIGLVAVLKLWAAAVPLLAVLVWLLASRPAARARIGALLLGVAVPVAATLVWLAVTGSLGAAFETWFVTPAQQLAQPGARTFGRLAGGVGRYVLLTLPVLALVAARLPVVRRERDPLDLALLAWVVAGLAVIAVQLWWSYHWVLLTPALLALAVRQLDGMRRGPVRWVALAAAALPLLYVGLATGPLALGDGTTAASRAAIDDRLGNATTVRTELAAAGVRPGESLYVLGDPMFQLEAGQPIPVRLNGWTPELFTDAQWAELAADLDRVRPRVVFVENDAVQLTAVRGRAVLRVLDDHYEQMRSSDAGVWYRLTSPAGGI